MATTDIEQLKFNLQERQYPYFSDTELTLLLEQYVSIMRASYHGCLLKASADDGLTLGPIKTASNRDYWLGLAGRYLEEAKRLEAILAEELAAEANGDTTVGYYDTYMIRVDGQ